MLKGEKSIGARATAIASKHDLFTNCIESFIFSILKVEKGTTRVPGLSQSFPGSTKPNIVDSPFSDVYNPSSSMERAVPKTQSGSLSTVLSV